MKSMPAFALLLSLCAVFPFGELGMAEEPAKPAEGATLAPVKAADSVLDDKDLTPAEKAEKESRKACKIDICRAFHSKEASGDIACHVIKSWRKDTLDKLVGKLKVSWPYGPAHCSTELNLKRAELAKALADPKAELVLDKHTVSCTIEGNDKSAETDFKFDLAPKITFENGKATKASANWGAIEAPTLIKSALWTATAADNTVNLLSGTIVDTVNAFTGSLCDEVKDQWAAKQ